MKSFLLEIFNCCLLYRFTFIVLPHEKFSTWLSVVLCDVIVQRKMKCEVNTRAFKYCLLPWQTPKSYLRMIVQNSRFEQKHDTTTSWIEMNTTKIRSIDCSTSKYPSVASLNTQLIYRWLWRSRAVRVVYQFKSTDSEWIIASSGFMWWCYWWTKFQ